MNQPNHQSPEQHSRRPQRPSLTTAPLFLALVLAVPLLAAEPEALTESLRLLYSGDPIKAASVASEYLKAHPDSADGRVSLAQAKMAVGDFETAYEQLRQAIRIDPKHVDALYHFGKLCAILSQLESQRLFAMAPDHYRVHQLMAESYLAQQNMAKAEEEYQAALRANPKSATVLTALGDLKRQQLGDSEAESPDAAAPSRYLEAISYYARAVKVDPNNYEALYGLGFSYLRAGKGTLAIENFRQAVRVEPQSAIAHLALGRTLLSEEKASEAIEELNATVRLEPKMRQAYFLLGRAYQKLGNTDLARQALAKERELRQAEFLATQQAQSTGGLPAAAPPAKDSAGNKN